MLENHCNLNTIQLWKFHFRHSLWSRLVGELGIHEIFFSSFYCEKLTRCFYSFTCFIAKSLRSNLSSTSNKLTMSCNMCCFFDFVRVPLQGNLLENVFNDLKLLIFLVFQRNVLIFCPNVIRNSLKWSIIMCWMTTYMYMN